MEEHESHKALIGVVVVIIILILGFWFLVNERGQGELNIEIEEPVIGDDANLSPEDSVVDAATSAGDVIGDSVSELPDAGAGVSNPLEGAYRNPFE